MTLNKQILKKIGLDKHLDKERGHIIQTLRTSKKICIDIGLSEVAPNSAIWLLNDPDRCVIGIEPLEYNWERLEGKHDYNKKDPSTGWPGIRINTNTVIINGEKYCDISNRFFDIRCAIDNVVSPQQKEFYHMMEEGSSSLLKPSSTHGSNIKKIETVQCVNLKSILELIDWEKFKVVEHLKVDCEGHDLEVIKSAQDYIEKIIFVTFEMSQHNQGHWKNHYNYEDAMHYMINRGFQQIRYDGGNINFFNTRFDPYIRYIDWTRFSGHRSIPLVFLDTSTPVYYCDLALEENQ